MQSNILVFKRKRALLLSKIGSFVLLFSACFSDSLWAEKISIQIIHLNGKTYESRTTDSARTDEVLKKNKPPENQYAGYNGSRGGGGGGFLCSDGRSKTENLYSIDYVLGQKKYIPYNFGNQNCASIIESIRYELSRSNPALAVGLADFMAAADKRLWQEHSSFDSSGTVSSRIWIKQCNGGNEKMGCMPDIPDDQYEYMPNTCSKKIQIAERIPWSNPRTIMTLVDVKAIEELEKNPIQCSHFYLHEWLRDFIPNAVDIRDFVSYLHSEALFQHQPTWFAYIPPTIGVGADRAGLSPDQNARTYYNEKILKAWLNPYQYSLGRDVNDPTVTVSTENFSKNHSLVGIALKRNANLMAGAIRSYIETTREKYVLVTVWKNQR